MFGNPAGPVPPSSALAAAGTDDDGEQDRDAGAERRRDAGAERRRDAGAERRRDAGRPGPVPPGLVPWLIPLLVVFLVVVFGALPFLLALPVALAVLIGILWMLYRSTRHRDYYELRYEDPLYRSLNDYRRGREHRELERNE